MNLNLLSGDYLFSSPSDAPSGYFAVLTAGFAVLLVASVVVYLRRADLATDNSVLRRLIRRVAVSGIWTSGIGLFLALMRYIRLDYLDAPILMLLLLLWMIGAVGYYVYDYSERYPIAVWRLQTSVAQRAYRPEARRRVAARPVRPGNQRGKRRK